MNQTNEGESPAARQYRTQLDKAHELHRLERVATGQAPGLVSGEAQKAAIEALAEMQGNDADPLNDELQAMRSVARTLEKLPPSAQQRVVSWLLSRFNEPRGLIGAGAYATQGLKGYP